MGAGDSLVAVGAFATGGPFRVALMEFSGADAMDSGADRGSFSDLGRRGRRPVG